MWQLVFRASSAHGRMPRSMALAAVTALSAQPPSEQASIALAPARTVGADSVEQLFGALYGKVAQRPDSLELPQFMHLLYLCWCARRRFPPSSGLTLPYQCGATAAARGACGDGRRRDTASTHTGRPRAGCVCVFL
jgi:hypothetical protein